MRLTDLQRETLVRARIIAVGCFCISGGGFNTRCRQSLVQKGLAIEDYDTGLVFLTQDGIDIRNRILKYRSKKEC